MENLDQYKNFAEKFVKEAGIIIREGFFKNLKRDWKEDDSIVTEYDIKINTMLVEQVQALFPDHAINGEESGYVGAPDAPYVWYCDPIDGTKSFSMTVPLITCILSLVYKDEPILGIIYDPILERIIIAEKGKGVLYNSSTCITSPHHQIKNSYVAFSVNMKYKWVDMLDVCRKFQKENVQFTYVHIGMAGLLLGSGNIDAIVLPFFKDYEYYALKIIFDEGCFVTTNLHGEPITDVSNPKQGLVVAQPQLHKEIMKVIIPHTVHLKL